MLDQKLQACRVANIAATISQMAAKQVSWVTCKAKRLYVLRGEEKLEPFTML